MRLVKSWELTQGQAQMDDSLRSYLAGKETRRSGADTARSYGDNLRRAMPRITNDIRESSKLASQLRVSGAAANRPKIDKD